MNEIDFIVNHSEGIYIHYLLYVIWACCSANNDTSDWNDSCACASQVHILVTFQVEEIWLMSYTFSDQKRAADLHCL